VVNKPRLSKPSQVKQAEPGDFNHAQVKLILRRGLDDGLIGLYLVTFSPEISRVKGSQLGQCVQGHVIKLTKPLSKSGIARPQA
jgi:hypothetical protein